PRHILRWANHHVFPAELGWITIPRTGRNSCQGVPLRSAASNLPAGSGPGGLDGNHVVCGAWLEHLSDPSRPSAASIGARGNLSELGSVKIWVAKPPAL